MCSYNRLRLVGGLVICKMNLAHYVLLVFAGRWGRVDF